MEVNAKMQMAKIRGFEKGFMATYFINIGDKVGLLQALYHNREGLTISELATNLDLHEPYLKIWCQTMYHFEVLDCDEHGRFRLQPFLDEILGDKSNYKNYLGNISLDVDAIGKRMHEVPESFRTGNNLKAYDDMEASRLVYETTKNIYLAFLFVILPQNDHLRQLMDEGIKFLDVGCGDGALIINLAQSFPKSKFVGISPDLFGISEAEMKISQCGLGERVSVRNIGGEDIDFRDEFNMIGMAVTLHEIDVNVREKVVQKAYDALIPGGYMLVLDFPYPSIIEDFRNPIYDYGILDQSYEMCMGTKHLSSIEQDEILGMAGFKNIQRMPIGRGMFDFITAMK
ncbi:MAG: class I SAM-dependent methyltransferase [Dethiobacteria bacterium]